MFCKVSPFRTSKNCPTLSPVITKKIFKQFFIMPKKKNPEKRKKKEKRTERKLKEKLRKFESQNNGHYFN